MGSRKFLPKNLIPEMAEPERPPPMPRSVGLEKSGFEAYNARPPATIAKLVQITPITMVSMVYGTYNELVFLGLLSTNVHITGLTNCRERERAGL
jgi:hypothetical protein